MTSRRQQHYSTEQVDALRTRAADLLSELAEVFDEIAARVQALNEEFDDDDAASDAAAARSPVGHDHC